MRIYKSFDKSPIYSAIIRIQWRDVQKSKWDGFIPLSDVIEVRKGHTTPTFLKNVKMGMFYLFLPLSFILLPEKKEHIHSLSSFFFFSFLLFFFSRPGLFPLFSHSLTLSFFSILPSLSFFFPASFVVLLSCFFRCPSFFLLNLVSSAHSISPFSLLINVFYPLFQ